MVKDLKDFLAKVKEDKALQKQLEEVVKASDPEKLFDDFHAVAVKMGYTFTKEDAQTYFDEFKDDMSDEDLDKVAGGSLVLGLLMTAAGLAIEVAAGYGIYKGVEYVKDKV